MSLFELSRPVQIMEYHGSSRVDSGWYYGGHRRLSRLIGDFDVRVAVLLIPGTATRASCFAVWRRGDPNLVRFNGIGR